MKLELRHAFQLMLVLAGCMGGGMNHARMPAPTTTLTPAQGIVIGTFNAEQMGVPNESPSLFVTVKNAQNTEYDIEFADKQVLKSNFFVVLPSGKWKLANGQVGGGGVGRQVKSFADANVYFDVAGGAVTCIGSIEAVPAESTTDKVKGVATNAFTGSYKASDNCDELTNAFKAQFPDLGGLEVKKAIGEYKKG